MGNRGWWTQCTVGYGLAGRCVQAPLQGSRPLLAGPGNVWRTAAEAGRAGRDSSTMLVEAEHSSTEAVSSM